MEVVKFCQRCCLQRSKNDLKRLLRSLKIWKVSRKKFWILSMSSIRRISLNTWTRITKLWQWRVLWLASWAWKAILILMTHRQITCQMVASVVLVKKVGHRWREMIRISKCRCLITVVDWCKIAYQRVITAMKCQRKKLMMMRFEKKDP